MGLVDVMREQLQGKRTTGESVIAHVAPSDPGPFWVLPAGASPAPQAEAEPVWAAPGGVRLPSAQGEVTGNGPSRRRIIVSYRDAGGTPRAWASGPVEVIEDVTACAAQHLQTYVNERRALGEQLRVEDFTAVMQIDTSTLREGDLVVVPVGSYGTQVALFVGYSRRKHAPRVRKWSAQSRKWTSTPRQIAPCHLVRWATAEDLRRVHLTPADVREGGAA
jgi:hypothetical protein